MTMNMQDKFYIAILTSEHCGKILKIFAWKWGLKLLRIEQKGTRENLCSDILSDIKSDNKRRILVFNFLC